MGGKGIGGRGTDRMDNPFRGLVPVLLANRRTYGIRRSDDRMIKNGNAGYDEEASDGGSSDRLIVR
jgi:hypothetical protein